MNKISTVECKVMVRQCRCDERKRGEVGRKLSMSQVTMVVVVPIPTIRAILSSPLAFFVDSLKKVLFVLSVLLRMARYFSN